MNNKKNTQMLLWTFLALLGLNLHRVQAAEVKGVLKQEQWTQHDRQFNNGSFEKLYAECQAGGVVVSFPVAELNLGQQSLKSLGIDGSLAYLNCEQIMTLGNQYLQVSAGVGVKAGHVKGT